MPEMGCAASVPVAVVEVSETVELTAAPAAPTPRQRRRRRGSAAEKKIARMLVKKQAPLAATVSVAAGFNRLKWQAREKIKARNKELAAAAPEELDSDEEAEAEAAEVEEVVGPAAAPAAAKSIYTTKMEPTVSSVEAAAAGEDGETPAIESELPRGEDSYRLSEPASPDAAAATPVDAEEEDETEEEEGRGRVKTHAEVV